MRWLMRVKHRAWLQPPGPGLSAPPKRWPDRSVRLCAREAEPNACQLLRAHHIPSRSGTARIPSASTRKMRLSAASLLALGLCACGLSALDRPRAGFLQDVLESNAADQKYCKVSTPELCPAPCVGWLAPVSASAALTRLPPSPLVPSRRSARWLCVIARPRAFSPRPRPPPPAERTDRGCLLRVRGRRAGQQGPLQLAARYRREALLPLPQGKSAVLHLQVARRGVVRRRARVADLPDGWCRPRP